MASDRFWLPIICPLKDSAAKCHFPPAIAMGASSSVESQAAMTPDQERFAMDDVEPSTPRMAPYIRRKSSSASPSPSRSEASFSSIFSGGSFSSKVEQLSSRQQECMNAYLALLDTQPIADFLNSHPEFDRYYLACVFIYFQRANLHIREYNHRKFVLALHIVNAVKEDDCENNDPMIISIFKFAKSFGFPNRGAFMHQRDCLLKRMDFRACVALRTVHKVISAAPAHSAWTRVDVDDEHDFINLLDDMERESAIDMDAHC